MLQCKWNGKWHLYSTFQVYLTLQHYQLYKICRIDHSHIHTHRLSPKVVNITHTQWLCLQGQFGVQHQGHFNMMTAEVGDQTTDPPIGRPPYFLIHVCPHVCKPYYKPYYCKQVGLNNMQKKKLYFFLIIIIFDCYWGCNMSKDFNGNSNYLLWHYDIL